MTQPRQQPAGDSGTGQGTVEEQLAGKLKDGEERLRVMVAKLDRDPSKIQGNLDSVKKVIMQIYPVLQADAAAPEGALAKTGGPRVWKSLKEQYHQAFNETEILRLLFKRFDELTGNDEQRLTMPELDEAAATLFNRRRQWLASVTEFQQTFSGFHNELEGSRKKKPA